MRKNGAKDISSTERLLELIRSGGSETASTTGVQEPAAVSSSLSEAQALPAGAKKWSLGRAVTVGVEITAEELRLAKVALRGKKIPQILGFHQVAVDPQLDRTSREFVGVLRSALRTFAPHPRRTRIWTCVGLDQAEIRNISVPKVPPAQLPKVVEWTAKKQAGYNARESLLDFEVLGEVQEGDVTKLRVILCLVLRSAVESLKHLFRKAGYPVTGVTFSPFAIENLMGAGLLAISSAPVAHVRIDAEHSRIDLFEKGKLQFCRVIKTGIRSMEQILAEELEQWEPSGAESDHRPENGDEVFQVTSPSGPSFDDPRYVLRLLDHGRAEDRQDGGEGTPSWGQGVMDLLEPVLGRLAKQVERTFDFCTRTLGYAGAETMYVSGFLSTSQAFRVFLEKEISMKVRVLDPLDPSKPVKGNVLPPSEIRRRVSLATVTGLALSDNRKTLNLLFNHAAKAAAARSRKLERGIFAVFLVCVVTCLALQGWQLHRISQKQERLSRLHQQLDSYRPLLDEATLVQLTAKYKKRRELLKQRIRSLKSLAVIREVVERTPRRIRFMRLKAEFAAVRAKDKPPHSRLNLEGLVLGEREAQKSVLSAFLMRLSASPLFGESKVESVSSESYENLGDVLHFNINLALK